MAPPGPNGGIPMKKPSISEAFPKIYSSNSVDNPILDDQYKEIRIGSVDCESGIAPNVVKGFKFTYFPKYKNETDWTV
jgi:hypothetical protein